MTRTTRPACSSTTTARTSSTPTATRSSTICRSSRSGGPTSTACWPRCATGWCRSRSTARPSTSCSALDLKTDEDAARPTSPSRAEPVEEIRTSEDVVDQRRRPRALRALLPGYTRKQWGLDPSELDKSVTARIPTRTNTDDRYFADKHQVDAARRLYGDVQADARQPADRPSLLGTDYRDVDDEIDAAHIIYTGPIDEYFDFRFGKLPYRSLRFEHSTIDAEQLPAGRRRSIIPTEDVPYTRISEYKHLTGQQHRQDQHHATNIRAAEGDPYYPIPRPENQALYKRYEALADATPGRDLRRPPGDLPLLQHGPDRRSGARRFPPPRRGPSRPVPGEGGTAGRGRSGMNPLQLWGGVECSTVRIGDEVRDQCRETGHFDRDSDLDAIAALGIRTLRYPILWDTVERDDGSLDFSWHDRRLQRLRELGIRVIGGLVHHGSGPRHTSVLDPGLAGEACRLCRQGRRALSVDRHLGAGQRAADHLALRLPLRPLVPAPRDSLHDMARVSGHPVRGHRSARCAPSAAVNPAALLMVRPRISARPSRHGRCGIRRGTKTAAAG